MIFTLVAKHRVGFNYNGDSLTGLLVARFRSDDGQHWAEVLTDAGEYYLIPSGWPNNGATVAEFDDPAAYREFRNSLTNYREIE